ncbi:MAG: GNAT family N-acetyltransferase [Candidatus Yanofskybacteria bacterium]|nr:GNAT family N-acetyltransferase [Candidatus Yanofskybacteria bacterium]
MKNTLKMRPLKLADADHIITWVNDPDVVKNLQHFNKKFTKKDELEYVKKILKSKNDFVFSFFNKSGKYVGQGGIHQISWENKLGRLSLIIKREHWNKGYAQEIIPALIHYAFKKLGLHKIWLMHWKENKKAEHLYKKLGFKKEGVLKDEYFWQGKYHDMTRMAVINS